MQRPPMRRCLSLEGQVINGRFKLGNTIGRGGMGTVYRAEQFPLGRPCAIKILDTSAAGDDVAVEFEKRFSREASVASKLTHPNTVKVYDFGCTEDGMFFIAMEYLEGLTLHRTIHRDGPFNESRMVHVARQICKSLREAHGQGIIHRDLKPRNIFLLEHGDEHDCVKVIDFGLAKLLADAGNEDLTLRAGVVLGTPGYVAPEQVMGVAVDARVDVYAAGIIMYEMVTGRVPFKRASAVETMLAHVHDALPPLRSIKGDLQLSVEAEAIILRCLEKTPDARFDSMQDLITALAKIGDPSLSSSAPHPVVSASVGSSMRPVAITLGESSRSQAPTQTGQLNQLLVTTTTAPSTPRPRLGLGVLVTAGILVTVLVFAAGIARLPRPNVAMAEDLSPKSALKQNPDARSVGRSERDGVRVLGSSPHGGATRTNVLVDTVPSGANVRRIGSSDACSPTPCVLQWDKGQTPPAELQLELSLAGYRTEVMPIRVNEEKVKVTLIPQDSPSAPLPTMRRPAPTKGFKAMPY